MRRDARGAAAAQRAVDAVAMQQRAAAADARRRAFAQHLDDVVVVFARERGERRRGAHQVEERVLVPLAAGALGDDLLRQDVERRDRRLDAVEAARVHGADRARRTRPVRRASSRRGGRATCSPSAWPERPMRCRNVVIARGEPIWQTRSTVPTSMPSSSDAVATMARISPSFSRCSRRSRRSFERLPWCAATCSSPRRSRQVVRDALGHAPRVDEDERRAVLVDQLGDAVVDVGPLLAGRDGLQVGRRHFDREVEVAPVPDVDDRAVGRVRRRRLRAVPTR